MYFILVFIFGLVIGSFLGVVIDRMPNNRSIIRGRSICNNCKHDLGILDLVPLFSFLFLQGKCRYCHKKLSIFYPLIEITTALLFLVSFYFLYTPLINLNLQFFLYITYFLTIISSFIVIFFIDLKHKIIPDIILGFDLVLILLWLIFGPSIVIINHFLTAVVSFVFFLLVSVIFLKITNKEGMGGGDIKFSFVLGLFLGFPLGFYAFYLAFLIGAFVSIVLIMLKGKSISSALPFGPFLIVGALISLFFQNQLSSIFFKFFGF